MATSSFDKEFVITDQDTIDEIMEGLNNPRPVKIKKKDYKKNAEEFIEKLNHK